MEESKKLKLKSGLISFLLVEADDSNESVGLERGSLNMLVDSKLINFSSFCWPNKLSEGDGKQLNVDICGFIMTLEDSEDDFEGNLNNSNDPEGKSMSPLPIEIDPGDDNDDPMVGDKGETFSLKAIKGDFGLIVMVIFSIVKV